MNKKELLTAWQNFAEKNDFKLNTDKNHVNAIIDGVLQNEKQSGLKLCPCRLRDGKFDRDLELICPCNFKAQDNWNTMGRCWCGLFVKR
jgi:ferredoxin-thioredoxin reductase catalytic subunit